MTKQGQQQTRAGCKSHRKLQEGNGLMGFPPHFEQGANKNNLFVQNIASIAFPLPQKMLPSFLRFLEIFWFCSQICCFSTFILSTVFLAA